MPFGLKNAGATYRRAMQKKIYMLHKNVECYVDDLVGKSKKFHNNLHYLRQVFERLRKFQLKMNPLKCAFGFWKIFRIHSATSGYLNRSIKNGCYSQDAGTSKNIHELKLRVCKDDK